MTKNNFDWLFFLSLEKDLINTIDYIEIHDKNAASFSISYLKLLLSACSAIERFGKRFCLEMNDSSKCKNIKEIQIELLAKCPKFFEIECSIPRFSKQIKPWASWGENKQTPVWWSAYNNVKHNDTDLTNASQKNAIEALAGLFCLNLYYYNTNINNDDLPLPNLFFYKSMPVYASYNDGLKLPDEDFVF